MQATLYVTPEAWNTANAIKDLNYHERLSLTDDESTDLSNKEGYYLKNANHLKLKPLPDNARIVLSLMPDQANYAQHVSFPAKLRGCLFENAPDLPHGYAGIVTYWSGEPINSKDSGAVYYQCPSNEYLVNMVPVTEEAEASDEMIVQDNLLSEGVVVCIEGLKPHLEQLSMHDYIEIGLPVDPMLGIESCAFRTPKAYETKPGHPCERIYLKVADILASPDCNHIYIDILRHELLDYGYWY